LKKTYQLIFKVKLVSSSENWIYVGPKHEALFSKKGTQKQKEPWNFIRENLENLIHKNAVQIHSKRRWGWGREDLNFIFISSLRVSFYLNLRKRFNLKVKGICSDTSSYFFIDHCSFCLLFKQIKLLLSPQTPLSTKSK